jgi:hypothetical protein
MFDHPSRRIRAIAMLGVVAALAIGGVAAAKGDSGSGSGGPQQGAKPLGPPPGAPGLPMKGLTYAEFHVQKDGQALTIRLDQGKITAIDESSITLSENDGSSVTIAIDEDTEVLAGPGKDATVDDLAVGQQVGVCGPEGGTAKSIMVPPKKGEMKGAPQGGPSRQLPPPPGGSPPGGGE